MSGPRFRTSRRLLAPRWLTDGEGGLIGYALDLIKDAFVERARLGLLARLPQNDPTGTTTAPPDALVAMGRDRRVVRAISESDASYAARLLTWLDDRKTTGNPFTLLRQLAAYCGPGTSFRTVDNSGNWYSRDAIGVQTSLLAVGNWNWDNSPSKWSRFWVIIYPGTLWTSTSQTWAAAGNWGNAVATWGSKSITQEQTTTLKSIVQDWKPAGTTCVSIILAFDPASFNPLTPEPDGNWGSWSKVSGGVRVPSRLATARYLDGV